MSKNISKKDLIKEYVFSRKTQQQVGDVFGINRNKVGVLLRKYGIAVRSFNDPIYQEGRNKGRSKSPITEEYLKDVYLTKKKTVNQIAKEFGVSWDTVRKNISKFGFPTMYGKMNESEGSKRGALEHKRFQEEVLSKRGYRCMICGYDKVVHVHHIVSWSRSKDNTLSNGIVLCPNHHAEADYGLLSKQELKSILKKFT